MVRYIVGFGLVEMAISTNPKPTIDRNLYGNTGSDVDHIFCGETKRLIVSGNHKTRLLSETLLGIRPRLGEVWGLLYFLGDDSPEW